MSSSSYLNSLFVDGPMFMVLKHILEAAMEDIECIPILKCNSLTFNICPCDGRTVLLKGIFYGKVVDA